MIIMLLSLKREKWVYPSSNHLLNLIPVEQYKKEPIHCRYTKFKQGRLEVFPLPVGNFYQTIIIIMQLFHLLKERLNIPIIPVMLIYISIIWLVNVIDQLKDTKIFLVRKIYLKRSKKMT